MQPTDFDTVAERVEQGDDAVPRSGRWATVAWLGSSLLLVALVVSLWIRVGSDRSGASLSNAIIAGDRPPAPAIPDAKLPDVDVQGLPSWYRHADGRQLAVQDAPVLVVNFWTSWCGPCREEAPVFNELMEDYAGRVHVVGMNAASKDLLSDAQAFVRRYRLSFTVVRASQAHEERWGVRGFPETFVIGRDGRISGFINGPVDEEELRGLVDAELDQERQT